MVPLYTSAVVDVNEYSFFHWLNHASLDQFVTVYRAFNDADPEQHIAFSKDCLAAVLEAYPPIIAKHKDDDYSERQKEWQLMRRGR